MTTKQKIGIGVGIYALVSVALHVTAKTVPSVGRFMTDSYELCGMKSPFKYKT